jgi:hypothetical protein
VGSVLFFNVAPGARAGATKRGILGLDVLPLQGFGDGVTVRLTCRSADCTSPPRKAPAVDGAVEFHFSPPLRGRFQIAASGKRTHLKEPKIGRFFNFSVDPITGALTRGTRGCLEPDATTVTRQTKIDCPEPLTD